MTKVWEKLESKSSYHFPNSWWFRGEIVLNTGHLRKLWRAHEDQIKPRTSELFESETLEQFTHHVGPLVEIHPNGSESVEQQWYEEGEHLDEGDPVGEVGPVVAGVAPELSLPGTLRHPPRQSLFSHNFPQKSHSMFPPEEEKKI